MTYDDLTAVPGLSYRYHLRSLSSDGAASSGYAQDVWGIDGPTEDHRA
ncbi:MAG: hypothetical protein R3E12_11310 [Candidatus Eisenbacteria bacterium]